MRSCEVLIFRETGSRDFGLPYLVASNFQQWTFEGGEYILFRVKILPVQ
jgi:hypothetical protein